MAWGCPHAAPPAQAEPPCFCSGSLPRPSPPPSWGTTPRCKGPVQLCLLGCCTERGELRFAAPSANPATSHRPGFHGGFLGCNAPRPAPRVWGAPVLPLPSRSRCGGCWEGAGWVPRLVMLVVHRQGGQRQLRHLTGMSISRNDRNCVLLPLPLLEGVRASCARGPARLAHGEGWLGAPAVGSAAWGSVCPRRFCIKPKLRILVMGTGFGVYGGLSLGLFHVPGSRFWRQNKEILRFRMGLLFKE